MTKKNIFISFGVILSIGVLWWGLAQTNENEVNQNDPDSEVRSQENQEQMRVLYQAPRDPIAVQNQEGSPECVQFWNELRGFDLSRQQSELPDLKAMTKSDKCGSVPAPLKNVHDHFNKTCGPNANSSQCLIALYFYRAALTDFLT
ncbi:MAG: hypothetical protein ACKN9V_05090, partial [Pseudomonadota bacterium]